MTTLTHPPVWSLLTRASLDALLDLHAGGMPEVITIAASGDAAIAAPMVATTRMMMDRAKVLPRAGMLA